MKSVGIQTMDEDIVQASLPSKLPLLPPLEAPDLRAAFVSNVDNSYEDANANATVLRLSFVGREIINFAVAATLFENSSITGDDLHKYRRIFTTVAVFSYWAGLYLDDFPVDIGSKTPSRRAELFSAYAGVIYQQDGVRAVHSWIEELIQYSEGREGTLTRLALAIPKAHSGGPYALQSAATGSSDSLSSSPAPHKRARLETDAPVSPSRPTAASIVQPGLVSVSPAPRLALSALEPAMSPAISGSGEMQDARSPISLILERCQKMGATIEWKFSQTGQPHAPQWTARLTCSQIDLASMGISTSKQAAKEDAARRAIVELDTKFPV